MKVVVQRVTFARLFIDKRLHAQIQQGLLVFIGIEQSDQKTQSEALIHKLLHFRLFNDQQQKMNLSLLAVGAELLLVSQFTLVANTENGLRPSFSNAATPTKAALLFEELVQLAKNSYPKTQAGVFGANMQIELLNDGPVTFTLTFN